MEFINLPSGQTMPRLGMGTWRMGKSSQQRQAEVAALRHGIDLGLTLIDTAEMYGEGGAEMVVAAAIAQQRSSIFLVSKFYPYNATYSGTIAACERSLKRLKTDYLDLYLLHWRSSVPLTETLEALQRLKQTGKIRDYGVSNFDTDDMSAALDLLNGEEIATNQILYNLTRRGVEWDLLPWCRSHHIPVMAYSPIEQGRLLQHQTLQSMAQQYKVSTAQIAIAWLLHQEQIIVIPKSSNINHIEDNHAALTLRLSENDLNALDVAFRPPCQRVALEIL